MLAPIAEAEVEMYANRDISQCIDSYDVEFCSESTASCIGHYSDKLGKSYGTQAQTLRSTGLAFPSSTPLLEKQSSGTQSQNAQYQNLCQRCSA